MDELDAETLDTETTMDSIDLSDTSISRHRDQQDPSYQWTMTAQHVQSNIESMARWILQKKLLYVSVEMSVEEASLIQSTVTSFTATTANEIESLRKLISPSTDATTHSHLHHHRTAIVQILLARLKEDIIEPFGLLQKQRSRTAIRLWQNPLECKLVVHGSERHKFMPTRKSHRLHTDFCASYQRDERIVPLKRPTSSLFKKKRSLPSSKDEKMETPLTPSPKVQRVPENDDVMYAEYTAPQALQQEALMLTASLHNDLDSAQQMEHMMVNITTLLSQFTELVSEQQEDVWEIRDATATAKENVEKGSEELADAKERVQQSKHYMAKSITTMTIVLLFFNWVLP
jgi:hypothetical protein